MLILIVGWLCKVLPNSQLLIFRLNYYYKFFIANVREDIHKKTKSNLLKLTNKHLHK